MSPGTPVNIYTTPAGLPPPGVVPNLINPPHVRKMDAWSDAICLVLSTIAVILRSFSKFHVMRKFGFEDYSLILAQLLFIAWIVLNFIAPGAGHHLWDISIYTSMQTAKYTNNIIILYGPPIFFAKLCVLLQLQHIFVVSRRQPIFFIIQALIWANLGFYLSFLFANIFQCVPRRKIWEPQLHGRCISTDALLLAPAGINIISDCSILIIPLVYVFRLKMTLKNKLAIVAVFSSGSFAVVSSVMRLVYSIWVTQTDDIYWTIYPVAMWAAAEYTTVVLAATFPILPRFWKYVRTGSRDGTEDSHKVRQRTPYSPQKQRQPFHVAHISSSGGEQPLKRGYKDLSSSKRGSQMEEIEMAILKTDTFEVSDHMGSLPDGNEVRRPQQATL